MLYYANKLLGKGEEMQDRNKVTIEHIESVIVDENYFTAADGYAGAMACSKEFSELPDDKRIINPPEELNLLTFCVLTLKNGFAVTGESACVSPENFDESIGKKVARENAIEKIWPLEGYLLKDELSKA